MRKTARRWLHQMREAPEGERETPFTRATHNADAVYTTLADVGEAFLGDATRTANADGSVVFERADGALLLHYEGTEYQLDPPTKIRTELNALDKHEELFGVEGALRDWWASERSEPFPASSIRSTLLSQISRLSDTAEEATIEDVRFDIYGDKRQAALAMYFERSDNLSTATDPVGRLATVDRIVETHEVYGMLFITATRGANDEWYLIGERDDDSFFIWELPHDPTSGFSVDEQELMEEVYYMAEIGGTLYDNRVSKRNLMSGASSAPMMESSVCHVAGDACVRGRKPIGNIAKYETHDDARDHRENRRRELLQDIVDDFGVDPFVKFRRIRPDKHYVKVRPKGVGDHSFDDREPFIRAIYENAGLELTFGSVEHLLDAAEEDVVDLQDYASKLGSIIKENINLQFEQRWTDVSIPTPEEAAEQYVADLADDAGEITIEKGQTTVRLDAAVRLENYDGVVLPEDAEVTFIDPKAGRRVIPLKAGQYIFSTFSAERA